MTKTNGHHGDEGGGEHGPGPAETDVNNDKAKSADSDDQKPHGDTSVNEKGNSGHGPGPADPN